VLLDFRRYLRELRAPERQPSIDRGATRDHNDRRQWSYARGITATDHNWALWERSGERRGAGRGIALVGSSMNRHVALRRRIRAARTIRNGGDP
jgi:hypothetical protein